jgi:hypothetical protein
LRSPQPKDPEDFVGSHVLGPFLPLVTPRQ